MSTQPDERAAYSAALDTLESEIRVGPDDYPLFHRGWQAGRLHERQVSAERMAALRTTVLGFRNVRTADDGLPCWCVTEHAHHKYGCDDLRAALNASTDGGRAG